MYTYIMSRLIVGGLGQLITSRPLPAHCDPVAAVYSVYYILYIIIFVFPCRRRRRDCSADSILHTIPLSRARSALKNVSAKKYINKYTIYIYIYKLCHIYIYTANLILRPLLLLIRVTAAAMAAIYSEIRN